MECLHRAELGRGLALVLRDPETTNGGFPTDRIPKAPTLSLAGVDLAEEGVGFGLPVVRGRLDTIFPGSFSLHLSEDPSRFALEFEMDLVERLARNGAGKAESGATNLVKEFFGFVHRRLPFTRKALTVVSDLLGIALRMRTVFGPAVSIGRVRVEYEIDEETGTVAIRADAGSLRLDGTMSVVLMNEAGARRFDRYDDSSGAALEGNRIESWNRVEAERASFSDGRTGVFFAAWRRPGARLFRGRELVRPRLSWSGLAYVLPAGATKFEYEIETGVRP